MGIHSRIISSPSIMSATTVLNLAWELPLFIQQIFSRFCSRLTDFESQSWTGYRNHHYRPVAGRQSHDRYDASMSLPRSQAQFTEGAAEHAMNMLMQH